MRRFAKFLGIILLFSWVSESRSWLRWHGSRRWDLGWTSRS